MADAYAGLPVETFRLREQEGGEVKADDIAAPAGKAARYRPGSGSQIENAVGSLDDLTTDQPVEECFGEPDAVARIIRSRLAKIDIHRTCLAIGYAGAV